MKFLKVFFLIFILFVVIDFIWLGVIASSFYKTYIGDLMHEAPLEDIGRIFSVIGVYILLTLGLQFFVFNQPFIKKSQIWFKAFLLGIIIYGVYEFTNFALLKNWSAIVVGVDIFWGGILCSSVAILTQFILFRKNLNLNSKN